MVQWGEQTFEEMMIGYLGHGTCAGGHLDHRGEIDFTPRSQKATMTAIQALRRLKGGNEAASTNQRRPLPPH